MKITMLVLFTPILFYTSYLLFGRIIKDYRFESTLVGEYYLVDRYGKQNGKLILHENRNFILEIDSKEYREQGEWYYTGGSYLRVIKLYNRDELILGLRVLEEDYGLRSGDFVFKSVDKSRNITFPY